MSDYNNSMDFSLVDKERQYLEEQLNKLINEKIGNIQISSSKSQSQVMPFGWRKAAKGRTVWRIVEEVISQNLEKYAKDYGFNSVSQAKSEVGVYDFIFQYNCGKTAYVNIKSSVSGAKVNKDDISKAVGLIGFFKEHQSANLYIATFIITFKEPLKIVLERCVVFPVAWIPDIYVNPSNNGNLQSAKYKDIDYAVKRTQDKFLEELIKANNIAISKKNKQN